jgi:hypothetical protein
MQVRVGVLEREKAELDDRVGALETQVAATDKLAAQDFATKVWNPLAVVYCCNSILVLQGRKQP